MPDKIKTAKIILQILGWLKIISAFLIFLTFLVVTFIIGVSIQEDAFLPGAIVGSVGVLISTFMVIVGIVFLLVADGIDKKKNWAKISGIVLGIMILPAVPVGTVLGIFILIGLFNDEATAWFES